ncbi:hypothetical protein EDB80DRAFT_685806 [Ilyonectria destructans]|nr:hypothetical protein EDB80DRAFT_685806 [Ilyonectria destructans]
MLSAAILLSLADSASAHIASWNEGMYCKGGNDSSVDNPNTNLVVNPLYNLTKAEWWMQADRSCNLVPPPDGKYLKLPAGKSLITKLANNCTFTILSYNSTLIIK